MIKTKFFLGDTIKSLEKEVNEFISKQEVKLTDIKLAVGIGQVICVILYTES